jgi:hypothetical protein
MDTVSDTWRAYLNRQTGELFSASDEELSALEQEEDEELPDWQREAIEKLRQVQQSDDWLELPSRFEIDEYRIMERFCSSVEDDTLREDLLDAIHGSGAFGRFKNMIHRHGLRDDWYRYREQQMARIAAEWLEANGIAYKD